MNEDEINVALNNIRKHMTLLDSIIHYDYKTKKHFCTEKQSKLIEEMFDLFNKMDWQISFNNYKSISYDTHDAIDKRGCGIPVKIRSCKKEHGDKTYFGILLGDIANSIISEIDDNGNITISHSLYNPAIFVPELNDIIYGYESWWSKIKNKEELNEYITNDTINNIWYMKLLNEK